MLRMAPEFLTRVFWAQTQGLVHRDAHAGLWNCIVAWWKHPPSPSGRALCFHIPCSSRHPKGCRWTWCCKSHPSVCALAAGALHLLWGVSPWTHPPSLRMTRKDHSGIWMPSSVDAKKRDFLFMSCPSGPGNPTLPGFSREGVGRRLGRNPCPAWSLPAGDGKSGLLTEELSSTPRTVITPLRPGARPTSLSATWPRILVLGCPSQAKLLSHHAAVFSHRRTSWMGLPLSTGFILSFLVTLPPFLNFVSCASQCPLLLHPGIWSGFFILTLRPLVGMAPTSLVPLLELNPPSTTSRNLPCSSLTEVRLKLSELSISAPKTNIVNFNGRAHHFFNNSWFSESKADGVTKHFSAKTNSTWFQKH